MKTREKLIFSISFFTNRRQYVSENNLIYWCCKVFWNLYKYVSWSFLIAYVQVNECWYYSRQQCLSALKACICKSRMIKKQTSTKRVTFLALPFKSKHDKGFKFWVRCEKRSTMAKLLIRIQNRKWHGRAGKRLTNDVNVKKQQKLCKLIEKTPKNAILLQTNI